MTRQRALLFLLIAIVVEVIGRYVPFWDNIAKIYLFVMNNIGDHKNPSNTALWVVFFCRMLWGGIIAVLCILLTKERNLRKCAVFTIITIASCATLDDSFFIGNNYYFSPNVTPTHFTGYIPYMFGVSFFVCLFLELQESKRNFICSWFFCFITAWLCTGIHLLTTRTNLSEYISLPTGRPISIAIIIYIATNCIYQQIIPPPPQGTKSE